MEIAWFIIALTSYISIILIKALFVLITNSTSNCSKLPPGPRGIPIITSIQWLRKSILETEAAVRVLYRKFGPIITIHLLSRPFIFIGDRSIAHLALIQNGALFADRPESLPTAKVLTCDQHNISSGGYGPIWRLLRRNLTSQVLHPSRARNYSNARKWVLDILFERLRASNGSNSQAIPVMEHCRFAMFSLLVFMTFGDKLEESQIKEIEAIQTQSLNSFNYFQILNLWPAVTKVLMRSRWNELFNLKMKREEVLLPHIRARKQYIQQSQTVNEQATRMVTSYVDTLLALELPTEDGNAKRHLTEEQLVTICSEFLSSGTDTTSTALQWIMANLIKHPKIQANLYEEIKEVIGIEAKEVEEDQLLKMPYLKAIILETLRRHPPSHFTLPHAVTQEVELDGYKVPKNAIVFFTVADMGWDPKAWEDPMEFKPERFLSNSEQIDITGTRETKMMPFGAGRRICPALGLAMLHLQYYVANMIWKYEWIAADGYEVDLTEKQDFTIVMKHPLQAHITRRHTSQVQ